MLKESIMKNRIHTGVFCLLAIFISFAVYNITHVLLTHFAVEQRLAETIGRLIASAGMLIFYQRVFGIQSFGIQKEYFFKGLVTGGFLFFVTLGNLILSIGELSEYPVAMPSLYLIFIIIIEQVFVGVFEEFLFRGLILNTLLVKMKDNQRKGKISAIFVSSVLFGLVHLLNLFDNPNMVNAVIAQVFYATFIGVFLGALYVRTHNIWVVVFYHAITNLAGELPSIFYQIPAVGTMTDEPFADAMASILMNLIFLFVGLFLVRKRKNTEDSL